MSARVAALYRYPVKSMGGAELERAEFGPAGIPGDRGWALRLRENGRPASAKRFAVLLRCRARYAEEPRAGKPLPPAEIELPDGTRTRTDAPGADALLSALIGADAAFARADADGFFDDKPLHLLTTASLKTLAAETGLDFDVRRFRPNVLVALDAPGRPEDAWIGGTVRVGGAPVEVLKPVKRCVMTGLPQPKLRAERGVLPALVARGGTLGVYARARAAGAWRPGDPVETA